ncbi:MAG: lysine--tRNA ligase [Pseudomonadota bacterium]
MTDSPQDENQLIAQRRQKLAALRKAGNPFPNDFRRTHEAGQLQSDCASHDAAWFADNTVEVAVAGRMMAKRVMGKASFASVQDTTGRIQLFVQRDRIGEAAYAAFKTLDVGDIVGATGTLFVTQKGELSVRVAALSLLTKSLRPLPEKFHGMTDQELRYRQRYVDLIVTEKSRDTFKKRAATIDAMRRFLVERDYLEIESPMMQVIPGGATAKPFITHHNALDRDLYLRVAQELPIKRALVGGFDRVFELNRVFRNEGLSTRHNPEFTMMECNEAYVDYVDYMDMTEAMLRDIARTVCGETRVTYQGETVDFGEPFARMTMRDAVVAFNADLDDDTVDDPARLAAWLSDRKLSAEAGASLGELQLVAFEETVEDQLRQPTFITQHPIEVSPLSRRSDSNPALTDRFELFITGREIANGFSELNDAEDQAERFRDQVDRQDRGDEEAMYFDADYVRALEYGLPPNAGLGIGVDRLVMLLTDAASIRDVILFPHMRPE